jgi:hypothetical protein
MLSFRLHSSERIAFMRPSTGDADMTTLTESLANDPNVLSRLGVTKTHAARAVRWLRNRGLVAFYRAADRSLNTWETKKGREWTYQTLDRALDETRA